MFSLPPWTIDTTGFDPGTARHYEGLFTQGSGYLHLRASLEEPIAGASQTGEPLRTPGNVTAEVFSDLPSRQGTYIPGVFADHPLLGHEMVNLPAFHLLTLSVEGETLDAGCSDLELHRRTFDLRDGLLRRDLLWITRAGIRIQAIFLRLISAARPHLCFQRVELSTDQPVDVVVTSLIDADVRTNGFDHFVERAGCVLDAEHVEYRVLTNGDDSIEIVSHFDHGSSSIAPIERARQVGIQATRHITPTSTPTILEKRTALSTSRDLEARPARAWLDETRELSWAEALEENRSIWRLRWRHSAIELTGDPESRRSLRTSIHHLLRCQVTGDDRVAIDAKGFAGEAYYGRFFWDTEVFLLPFFLYTAPSRARDLVSFRLRTLAGARANARREGRPGARYPWESSTTGTEECPAWPYNEQEIHVTADVVYGLVHYARAAEPAFLEREAAEAIVECARYWIARIETDPHGELHLNEVLGPDEYTPSCTDNAFTNRLVRFALAIADEVGAAGGATEAERERFREFADRLPIPRSRDGELILQCEGFDSLEEPDLTELWPDRSRPLAAQVPEEELYPLKVLKQADVLALATLFPLDFDERELRRAWEYYLPFTTHDSSLSASVHSLVASRLKQSDEAWSFWLSARDLDLSRGGAAEGLHIANAAGSWMGVVFGFAGLTSAMWTETLTLNPRLPAAWGAMSFPLIWLGTPVRIAITSEATTIASEGESPIEVRVGEERRLLAPGTTETFSMPPSDPVTLGAVLFDLDGVLISTDHLHFQAWTELTKRERIPFDWELNDQLRGVSRRRSLEIILEAAGRSYPEAQLEEMLEWKNNRYRASLETLSVDDILPGALELLETLRRAGIPVAVVSSSRNAGDILRQTGLMERIDLAVDGNDVEHGKPDPEGFLLGAQRLGALPAACVVIEDAPAGVEAGLRAGCAVVALGSRDLHPGAPHRITTLEDLTEGDLRAIVASPAHRGFHRRP